MVSWHLPAVARSPSAWLLGSEALEGGRQAVLPRPVDTELVLHSASPLSRVQTRTRGCPNLTEHGLPAGPRQRVLFPQPPARAFGTSFPTPSQRSTPPPPPPRHRTALPCARHAPAPASARIMATARARACLTRQPARRAVPLELPLRGRHPLSPRTSRPPGGLVNNAGRERPGCPRIARILVRRTYIRSRSAGYVRTLRAGGRLRH
ncbi:hypothetical protein DAI22_03g154501 [Oryza sativa Japonica Group]|nr:hypothetical protein DAI22_03g154501 [Oryza sativa Japonica Group]